MKLLIVVCTIILLSLVSSAEADCSPDSWNVVPSMPASEIIGRWYCVLRFPNGKNDTSDCLWHDLRLHPTIPNAIQDNAKRTFKNGINRTKHEVEGVVTPADPSVNNGLAHVVYKKAGDVLKYVTAGDFNDFATIRVCFEGEEHFWAYARNQMPSNSTMEKIYKEIDDQGIDRSKLIKSCTDVPAAALV